MSYSNYHPQFLSNEDWEPQNREITGRSPLSERDNIISLTIHRKRYLNGDRNNCEMNTQKVTLISDRCRVQLTSQTRLVIPSTPNIPSTPFLRGTNVLLDHNTVPNAPPKFLAYCKRLLHDCMVLVHGSCILAQGRLVLDLLIIVPISFSCFQLLALCRKAEVLIPKLWEVFSSMNRLPDWFVLFYHPNVIWPSIMCKKKYIGWVIQQRLIPLI